MENNFIRISGEKEGKRISSRKLEEIVQMHIEDGCRKIEIEAFGQHGIGGRLWRAGKDRVQIRILGHSGQRAGSLGNENTEIEIMGPASDDVGWLNAGAQIVVHGNASNGVMNGAAQGRVYIGGNIGARGMTMTKRNPRFAPPELWVLGSSGDYFGEFMAGGICVICGCNAEQERSVLGYRSLVGMVGGRVFVRGNTEGFSEKDVKSVPLSDKDWIWLKTGLGVFLDKIRRTELKEMFSVRSQWQVLEAKSAREKITGPLNSSMARFRTGVWDRELGKGGLIGDLQETEEGAIPLITRGDLRRYVPVWEQGKYAAPCQAACPVGIPVRERWYMIRSEEIEQAVNMALEHTPFPATVCGYLCPNPCMASCTRNLERMAPIDARLLGRAGPDAEFPDMAEKASGRSIAVIGAGPGGISAAWHLTLKGHKVTLFDTGSSIGGKIFSVIPESRIPREIIETELKRAENFIPDIRLGHKVDSREFSRIRKEYDFVIIAIGAEKPRSLPVPGIERALSANDFLKKSGKGEINPGRKVVVIGAGNVGCDVATEASRLGAEEITLIDIQRPLASGKEKEDAEAVGAKFRWPCFTKAITEKGVVLEDGELIEADRVIFSIGDIPVLDFLGDSVRFEKGFIAVDDCSRTSDSRIFAAGDAAGLGLIADAIGAGKRAALSIDSIIEGKSSDWGEILSEIDKDRISLQYYNPVKENSDLSHWGDDCASCGRCRDCGICVTVCPEGAIERIEAGRKGLGPEPEALFEYRAVSERCIGCGFCRDACPCGIWDMKKAF